MGSHTFLKADRTVDHNYIKNLEHRILQSVDIIIEKQIDLVKLKQEKKRRKRNVTKVGLFQSAFILFKNVFIGRVSDTDKMKKSIANLKEINRQLFLELVDVHNDRDRVQFSKTLKGKYFNFLGFFFSIYCVLKIVMAIINILLDRVGKVDPITRGIEISVNYLGFNFDVRFWAQQLSFWLIGIIIITSIRGFLLTLTKGMYFVSMVLLIRMNMPYKYRKVTLQLLDKQKIVNSKNFVK
ncbi:hypothetical protein A3Q56_00322 [Intoshia linei]|uniref:Abscisic acid G-protein coupled receptor-like domain-containing protein n=1 Tax=Intoshia linei TaxID=1819745 RepID=A0A177BEA0_9BILA|nr:hypothetical protein A3Q56_00322 [Intoshia linei]